MRFNVLFLCLLVSTSAALGQEEPPVEPPVEPPPEVVESTAVDGEQISTLRQILYVNAITAVGVGVISGMYFWRLVVLSKNQRNIW